MKKCEICGGWYEDNEVIYNAYPCKAGLCCERCYKKVVSPVSAYADHLDRTRLYREIRKGKK